MAQNQTLVHVSGLEKYYGDFHALKGVSFDISRGEVVGLLGLNGAGKTTCIRLLTGFLTATSGTIEIDGHNVLENPILVRQQLGYLPEQPPLYTELTVYNYLKFIARLRGVGEDSFEREFEEVTEKTSLVPARNSLIRHLSLGYRKRVGIAQTLMGSPDLLIYDEPVSGLDPRQISEVRALMRDLAGEHTILISSHILTEVSRTCDRALVIHRGELVGNIEGNELKEHLEERFEALTTGEVEVGQ